MAQIPFINATGLQVIAQYIYGELAKKVNTEEGKGLSTNDFTTALKEKLEGINVDNLLSATDKAKIHDHSNKGVLDDITQAAVDAWTAAQANVLESVKVNGTAQTIDANKAVDIAVPTAVSDLTNDSNFQTQDEVTAAIASAVGQITGIDFSIVQALPQSGTKGVIYLVPAENNGTNEDVYDEYIWLDGANEEPGTFEKIGTTAAKFSQYWSKSEVTFAAMTSQEITAAFDAVFNPSQEEPAGGE